MSEELLQKSRETESAEKPVASEEENGGGGATDRFGISQGNGRHETWCKLRIIKQRMTAC